MRYDYKCPKHGVFEVVQKMEEATGTHRCPSCGMPAKQVFNVPPPPIYRCDGFFATDHFKGDNRPGDKRERLNKSFEDAGFGPPPPPDPSVDRNKSRQR